MPGDVISVSKHRYEIAYSPNGAPPPPEEDDPFAMGLLEKAGLSRREPGDAPRGQRPSSAASPAGSAGKKDDDDLDDDDLIWLDDDQK